MRGCDQVSPGCKNCYAKHMAARIVRMGKGNPTPYDGLVRITARGEPAWTGEVAFDAAKLADPLRWKKPSRIFVNSMSDLFHETLTNEQIAAVFGVMAAAPQHTFQVLTKRARRMREWFEWVTATLPSCHTLGAARGVRWYAWEMFGRHHDETSELACSPSWSGPLPDWQWPLTNVWLGVSVENQDAADERIPELLATPAAIRFLSCEPLLGAVNLDSPRCDGRNCGPDEWSVADDDATPWCSEHDQELSYGHWLRADGGIDWVITGCESGPGARPCGVEWLRSLRDQCAAAGVPFFLKQARENNDRSSHMFAVTSGPGSKRKPGGVIELPYLDGVQHAAMPNTRST